MKTRFMRVSAFLTIILLSSCIMSGCWTQMYKGALSCVSCIENGNTLAMMDLTEDAQKEILSILNSGDWLSDIPNCGYDYEFTTKSETIRYHSECGTFIDITNHRSLELSKEDQSKVNKIFGFYEADDQESGS